MPVRQVCHGTSVSVRDAGEVRAYCTENRKLRQSMRVSAYGVHRQPHTNTLPLVAGAASDQQKRSVFPIAELAYAPAGGATAPRAR